MREISLKEIVHRPFKVTELEIPVSGLEEGLRGFCIVQLSDLHVGVYTSRELLEKAIEYAASRQPNLILHTGDFVHTGRHDVKELLFKAFGPNVSRFRHYRRLARFYSKELSGMLESLTPSHGSYAVWGNHDYIEGLRTIKRYLPKGITILKNSSCLVPDTNNKILISGLDDQKCGEPSITEAVKSLNNLGGSESAFKILLNHNPDALFAKDKALLENYDLILGGHTHGGQVCLPGSVAITTQTKSRKFYAGLDKLGKNTHVYTSRGIGCAGIPLRLFCQPEIVVIRLILS